MLTDAEEALIDYVAANCTSNAMACYDLREDDRVSGILLMGHRRRRLHREAREYMVWGHVLRAPHSDLLLGG